MKMKKTLVATMLSGILLAPAFNFAADKAETAGVAHHARTSKSKAEITTPVNINQADVKTLTTLKDIGPKKAEAIIAYRSKNGDFKVVEDLLQVHGISKRILKDNESRITVS